MSQNSIQTQEFARTINATVEVDIPILEYVNKKLSDSLESGSGATVSALVPNFGKVRRGVSMLGTGTANVPTLDNLPNLRVQVDKVPVQVDVVGIDASYDLLEQTLKLFTKDSQIREPRISNLARTINKDVFQCVLTAAHSSIVGQIGFPDLGEACAYVDESRVGEENAGMLSPLLNNSIASSGANKFAHPKIGTDLYRGVLGSYCGADFFSSADAGAIKIGNSQGASPAFAFSGNVQTASLADGSTSLQLTGITFGGGNTLTAIPKGTPIVVGSGTAGTAGSITSAYTVSSVYGEDTQVIRTFVVLETAPITGASGSATATVQIAPLALNQRIGSTETLTTKAVANTWFNANASPGPTQPFICPLLAGTKYALGAVFASKSIVFASAAPKPFANADSQTYSLDGHISSRTSIVTEGIQGQDIWRVDVMYGMKALYGQGAVALYGMIG